MANPGLGAVAPAPPDVPAGGLYVQGGPSSSSGASDSAPVAFSALVFPVPTTSTAETLELQMASRQAGAAPTLELCPLDSSNLVKPEQGGSMSDAPAYSCARWVEAGPDPAGTGYQFPVGDLVRAGVLAVAVLPTSPLDQVALERPGAGSLVLKQAPPLTAPTTAAPSQAGAGEIPDPIPASPAHPPMVPPNVPMVAAAGLVGAPASAPAPGPTLALPAKATSIPAGRPGWSLHVPAKVPGPTRVSFWVVFILPLVLLAGTAYLGWVFTVAPDDSAPPRRAQLPAPSPKAVRRRQAVTLTATGF
ncbi:MAG TPA: hypothetical protein VFP54_06675 [Acidimicrobiales bacterium]|nr:hypothetical protein [Acidimicrobiales bacterium]